MTQQDWLKKLQEEGFQNLRVCPIPPNTDMPEHTHDLHTVHIILEGELAITQDNITQTYKVGDRVDFPAGTKHKARGATNSGTMIVGEKG